MQTIYGLHPVIEALDAGANIDKIYIKREMGGPRIQTIQNKAKELQVPVVRVPEIKLEQLAGPQSQHQGVVAVVAAIRYLPLEEIIISAQERGEALLLVMLDGVTDVRNVGAIARTAECMGAHALIIPYRGGASINADAVKVSAGALNHLPVCRVDSLLITLKLLPNYGIHIIASTEKAEKSIYQMDFAEHVCILMGSEESGIEANHLRYASELVKIPMLGKVSSLNVSVATGMILSEVVRQRLLINKGN